MRNFERMSDRNFSPHVGERGAERNMHIKREAKSNNKDKGNELEQKRTNNASQAVVITNL